MTTLPVEASAITRKIPTSHNHYIWREGRFTGDDQFPSMMILVNYEMLYVYSGQLSSSYESAFNWPTIPQEK